MDDQASPAGPAQPGTAAGGGRAQRRLESEAAAAPLSRTERRRLEEAQAKDVQTRHSLWRAWWLYALLALVGLAVFLGFRSAADAPPPAPQITTITTK